MEVIKDFTTNNYEKSITILGTNDNLLFRASEIAEILEIKCISTSTADFDENEKIYKKIQTPGGNQNITFITEIGLYKLLFRSRKKIAKDFQDWVLNVIKELRINGTYTIEKKYEKIIEEKNEELEKIKVENEILTACKEGTPVIYVYHTDVRPETKNAPIKIGITEKLRERTKPYKQTHPWGRIVFSAEINNECISLKAIEHWVHTLLKKYLVAGELFSIDCEEAKFQIMHVINTIKLTNEENKEERKLKFAKLIENETMIINNMSNPNISIREISTQTDHLSENEFANYETTNKIKSKFDKYVDECCETDANFEVSAKDIIGQYRIWSKSADQESYRGLLDYLKTYYKPIRLKLQDKDHVINGFKGIRLKHIEYKLTTMSDPDIFVFYACVFSPAAKILRCEIAKYYNEWRKRNNKKANIYIDTKEIVEYLSKCQHVLPSNVWTQTGNGTGYYGINLKSHEIYTKKFSSTAKKVQKREIETDTIIDSWNTVAKAAEAEGISAAKMSRCIKNKTLFENYYYSI